MVGALFELNPLSLPEARQICQWTYGPGWALYDFGPGDLAAITAPSAGAHGVHGDQALAGLACFGAGARVPGGNYRQRALDIGCSMAPELVGHGLGRAFVEAIVVFARRRFRAPRLRLVVPAANLRAIKVYRATGFVSGGRFAGMLKGGIHPFLQMTWEGALSPD